jgi:hypothetical protein
LDKEGKLAADSSEIVKKLVQGVEGDFEKKRKVVEKWFDDSMDRVSGWYKRKAHAWLWLVAVVVCGVLNADSIGLARLLWNDEALRQSVVTAATTYVKENKKPTADTAQVKDKKVTGEPAQSANDDKKTGPDAGTSGSTPDSKAFDNLKYARQELDQSGIPLGWCSAASCWPLGGAPLSDEDPRLGPKDWLAWLLRITGILVTALAVSQGAPFWFDLLQKAVDVRLSGSRPKTGAAGADTAKK